MPRPNSSFTECCVGLVLNSFAEEINGTNVMCINRVLFPPNSVKIRLMVPNYDQKTKKANDKNSNDYFNVSVLMSKAFSRHLKGSYATMLIK